VDQDSIHKPHVLLVEDEEDAAAMIAKLLEHNNYRVTAVTRCIDALNLLQAGNIYDVMIVDLLLPDMGGAEFVAIVRHDKRFENIPIIISTAIADDYTRTKNQELGISGFLTKPYTTEQMLTVIGQCLDGK